MAYRSVAGIPKNRFGETQTPALSDAAVRLCHPYTGRGPTRSRTTINHDSVMILLGDTLTRGERKLVETGEQDRVLQLRHDFQMVMRQTWSRRLRPRSIATSSR